MAIRARGIIVKARLSLGERGEHRIAMGNRFITGGIDGARNGGHGGNFLTHEESPLYKGVCRRVEMRFTCVYSRMRILTLACATLLLSGCAPSRPPPEPTIPEKPEAPFEKASKPEIKGGEDLGCLKMVHHVRPVYPEKARKRGISGSVELKVSIHPDGTVGEIEVLSGDPLLTPAAIAAVRQWRYELCEIEGIVVPVTIPVSVRFGLTQ